jgi:glycosyltransferase involved in cell wall biosynthesis
MDRIAKLSGANISHPWLDAETAPIVLGVGSLAALKDFPTLINAFSIVRSKRECRLVILGDGPDRGKLESLIHQLGLQRDVYLPGFVGNPFAWMRHAAVFVSSSLTEGCPNALMQALACGTPVISTDCVGGSAEILEQGKWGRLVSVGDSIGMAESILATFDSTHHPDVRQRAKDFAVKEIAAQYLRVLFPADLSSAWET